jgi:hypothetical protein
MNDDSSQNYILLARKQFTSLLIYSLYPAIWLGINQLWIDSKTQGPPKHAYENFQHKLSKIRKWNQDIITSEYERVVKGLKSEFSLDDLVKKIFVINTQILASVNMGNNANKQIKVKVPKGDKFIHVVYKECGRSFYENPLLFEDRPITISKIEMSKNLQKSYKIIMQCTENAILNLLPIDSLLKDSYDSEGEDITPPSNMYKDIPSYTINNGSIHVPGPNPPPHYEPERPTEPERPKTPELLNVDLNSILSQASQPQSHVKQITFDKQGEILKSVTTTEPTRPIEHLPTSNMDLNSQNSQNSISTVPNPNEIALSLPTVVKSDSKIDLEVFSQNDEPQKHEAPSLPDINKFDSMSFFSDAGSEA